MIHDAVGLGGVAEGTDERLARHEEGGETPPKPCLIFMFASNQVRALEDLLVLEDAFASFPECHLDSCYSPRPRQEASANEDCKGRENSAGLGKSLPRGTAVKVPSESQ